MANKAIFTIGLEGNASKVAQETAASIEGLSTAIADSEEKIKAMNADLRRLTGSSEAVKKEKDRLKAAIKGEKQEITSNVLELKKLGATSTDVAKKQKALAEEEKRSAAASKQHAGDTAKAQSALKTVFSATGGPVGDLSEKLSTLGEVTEALSAGEIALAGGVALAAAAVVGLAGAVVYGESKLLEFVVQSRSAAREMNLFRQGATGSADNAQHLGEQVDALAKRVPVARTEINKLGLELGRMGLRGNAIVDSMSAIEQATGAGDDALANFSKDVITRGRVWNRFWLSPMELMGKNMNFDDVASELAKSTHKTIDEARTALLTGQVDLESGANAMANALKKKYGDINEQLLLDPGKQVEKFKENLADLTSGVDIKPLLGDMHEFFDLFDSTKTTTGAALKQLVSSLGGDLADGIHESTPVALYLVRSLVLGALKVDNAWLGFKISLKSYFAELGKSADALRSKLGDLTGPVGELLGINPTFAPKSGPPALPDAISSASKRGIPAAEGAGGALAAAASKGFTDTAEIHSPSAVFVRHTEQLIAGVTNPLRDGRSDIANALNIAMGPMQALDRGGASASSSSTPSRGGDTFHFTFVVGDKAAARELRDPNLQAQLKRLFQTARLQAGYGTT